MRIFYSCSSYCKPKKININVFINLLNIVHGFWVLWKFVLYKHVQYCGSFDVKRCFINGNLPYLIVDKGYSFISWIMTPYIEEGIHIIIKHLYQKKEARTFYNWKCIIKQVKFECFFYPKSVYLLYVSQYVKKWKGGKHLLINMH